MIPWVFCCFCNVQTCTHMLQLGKSTKKTEYIFLIDWEGYLQMMKQCNLKYKSFISFHYLLLQLSTSELQHTLLCFLLKHKSAVNLKTALLHYFFPLIWNNLFSTTYTYDVLSNKQAPLLKRIYNSMTLSYELAPYLQISMSTWNLLRKADWQLQNFSVQ